MKFDWLGLVWWVLRSKILREFIVEVNKVASDWLLENITAEIAAERLQVLIQEYLVKLIKGDDALDIDRVIFPELAK